jgi:GNAT superfamily N-acetyltransferase
VSTTAIGCSVLSWDSDFWGRAIGRVDDGPLDQERLRAVDAWAADNAIDCLFYLAASDDIPSVHVAEGGGFRCMDARIDFECRTRRVDPPPRVRSGRPDDVDPLREIARRSHDITRFYADPGFPDERCGELYDLWLVNSFHGFADEVLVLEVDGRAAGYVTCHAKGDTGSIGLIGVEAAERGRGLGRTLVLGAIDWSAKRGLERMTVATQGRNLAAQRAFEAGGFRTESVGLWFHKWYLR